MPSPYHAVVALADLDAGHRATILGGLSPALYRVLNGGRFQVWAQFVHRDQLDVDDVDELDLLHRHQRTIGEAFAHHAGGCGLRGLSSLVGASFGEGGLDLGSSLVARLAGSLGLQACFFGETGGLPGFFIPAPTLGSELFLLIIVHPPVQDVAGFVEASDDLLEERIDREAGAPVWTLLGLAGALRGLAEFAQADDHAGDVA